MNKDYKTLAAKGSAEFVEKKSRFIGYAAPVETEEEAIAFINEIRSKHRDARHNVYAYLVNNGGTVNQRYSDDGEPQDAGGMPVMDVILKTELTNLCIVVTRYFGGVLLGASGLVRAYSKGASIAVEAAGIRTVVKCRLVEIVMPYGVYDKISSLAEAKGYEAAASEFGADVRVSFAVPVAEAEAFAAEVTDASAGKANCNISDDII